MDQDAYKKHNKPEDGGKAGVYEHPNVPSEILEVREFSQADALLRQGWVYKGPLPSRVEIAERRAKMLADQAAEAKKSEGNPELQAANAELAAAKAEEKAAGKESVEQVTAGEQTHPSIKTNTSQEEVPSAPVTKDTPKALKESK